MLRKLVLLLSIMSFVLGGASFSHAAELHGHGSSESKQVAGADSHQNHAHQHHDESGGDRDGTEGSTVHCGAPILGTEPVPYNLGMVPRTAHEHAPVLEFVGQSYALDPPPPRVLFS